MCGPLAYTFACEPSRARAHVPLHACMTAVGVHFCSRTHACMRPHSHVHAHHCVCNFPFALPQVCLSAVGVHFHLRTDARVHTHACMHTCMYAHTPRYTHIIVCATSHLHFLMYVFGRWRTLLFARTCAYAHICIHAQTCMYAFKSMYAHTLMYAHLHIIVCITARLQFLTYARRPSGYIFICSHMHVCAHSHVHAGAHHCAHNCPFVFSHACVSALGVHFCVRTHACMGTNPHVY